MEITKYVIEKYLNGTKGNLNELEGLVYSLLERNGKLKEKLEQDKSQRELELEKEINRLHTNSLFIFDEEQQEKIREFRKENYAMYFEVFTNSLFTTVELKDYHSDNKLMIFGDK